MRMALVGLICLAAMGCERQNGAGSGAAAIEAVSRDRSVPWTSLAPRDDPDDFHFVVVTDRTGQHRTGVFAGAMPKVNLLSPAFVVSVGDLIEGYTENQESLDREWDEMEGFIAELESPFFYTPGNHDMSNAVMAETWQRRFGPSFYHFEYKDVLFVVLNSELFGMVGQPDVPVPGPWTQAQQMQFVEQVLADNADARWTIVLLHQPLWDYEDINDDWLKVEELLGTRNYTVFAGHFHRYSKQRRHDRNFITLATTGGGSPLRGSLFGEFDHVAWVTMTQDGPRIANVMLSGITGDDVSNPRLLAQAEALAGSVSMRGESGQGETFSQAEQIVTVTNPSAGELYVTPVLSTPGNFNVQGLEPMSIGPGQSVQMPLALSVPAPVRYRDLRPAAITWTLTGEVEGSPAQVQAVTPVLPLTTHGIPSAVRAPVIDGDHSDWDGLRYVVDRQGDVASRPVKPQDVSYRFDLKHDDQALYVAVEVTDDSLVSSAERIAREQDAVVVAVDPREPELRNRSMDAGEAVMGGDMASMAMLILTVGETAPDTLLGFLEETAEVARTATVTTEDGYRTEVAIPHALLDEKAGGRPWDEARITVSVYDFDAGEHGGTMLHWQPYRYGNAPLAGTHTFSRQP